MNKTNRLMAMVLLVVFLSTGSYLGIAESTSTKQESWVCSNCGEESIGRFCSNCGNPRVLSWECPNCGNTATGNFCSECGTGNPLNQPSVEVSNNDDVIEKIVGTYIGMNGSSLILYEDGKADYYWKDWITLSEDNDWRIEDQRVIINLKSMHCEVYADIPTDDSSLLLQSKSILWDDEIYQKITSDSRKLTYEEHKDLVESFLNENTGEIIDTKEMKNKTVNTEHFAISIPDYWELDDEEAYFGIVPGHDYIGLLILSEDYVVKENASNEDGSIIDTLSKTTNEKAIGKKITMVDGFPALYYEGPLSEQSYLFLMNVSCYGNVLTAIYCDSSGDSEDAREMANDLFSTIECCNDDIQPKKQRPKPVPATTNKGKQEVSDQSSGNELEDDQESVYKGEMVAVTIGNESVMIHKSFKQAMDAYEAFFDEYVNVMKSMDWIKLAEFMGKYTQYLEELENIGEEELTDAELAYYMEVYARIMYKLSKIGNY